MVHIASRLLIMLLTLLGVTFLTFALIHLVPGDPVEVMMGQRQVDPTLHAQALHNLGLDRPLWVQYLEYLKALLRGDFGVSMRTQEPFLSQFFVRFTATAELSCAALLFALVVGLPLGIIAALKRQTLIDYAAVTLSLIGYSMPIFWWGLLAVMFFSIYLGLTPVSGRMSVIYDITPYTGFLIFDTLFAGNWHAFVSALNHLILPALILGTIPLAVITRMTRASMIDVLGENYLRTAKANGLSRTRILLVHALRNALIPIITVIGLQGSTLLAGAVLTETIFAWPGMGKWMVDAIAARDYPIIQSGILFIAATIMTVNMSVDLATWWLDPRLRRNLN